MFTMTNLCGFGAGGKDAPPPIGAAWMGGYYAGSISFAGNGVVDYHLIVSPKATGETAAAWGPVDATTGVTSAIAGPTNTASLYALGASYAAATFCRDLTIGGFTDWYLPAINELEVLYYFLKPTTASNNTGHGSNANAVYPEPISTNYSAGSPAQTSVTLFQTGQAEAFVADYYWASTEYNTSSARQKRFSDGYMGSFNKDYANYVRAVRRVEA
jgi:hypothetical protein